ncbi:hypothetical protein ACHAXA_002636 [Cyclostephanos tholiformis]|uniref:Membrane-associated protein n=1 Tax=Cyclostephanos tholiformis TaxID=382380 RepID=A0ABD3SCQ0_9STRA
MGVRFILILILTLLAVNVIYLYLSTVFVVAPLITTPKTGTRFGPPEPAGSNNIRNNGAKVPRVGVVDVSGGGHVDRDLDFLEFAWEYPTHDDPGREPVDINHQDAYSGSWWQSTSAFAGIQFFAGDELLSPSQESATFQVFRDREKHVSVTRDWLDLGVEHMSKWWQQALPDFQERELAARSVVEKISTIFQRYVHSHDRWAFFHALPSSSSSSSSWKVTRKDNSHTQALVTRSTIAVIAFTPSCRNCVFARTVPGDRNLTDIVNMWSLAATLMSLIQTGIGRIVVSSHLREDEDLVHGVFAIVANATSDWNYNDIGPRTMLEFCVTPDAAIKAVDTDPEEWDWDTNVPVAMLRQLHRVLVYKTTDVVEKCWLGEGNRGRWEYVYFSEADLVLVTKPDALVGLGRALRAGRLLAPHRLQPLPHASDFGGIDEILHDNIYVIPNRPPFKEVIEVDSFGRSDRLGYPFSSCENAQVFDSCCDRGTYKPNLIHEDCGNFWWQCGYGAHSKKRMTSNPVTNQVPMIMVAHKRLLGYKLMRLKRGTGVMFASAEGGKTCRPHVGPCNNEYE